MVMRKKKSWREMKVKGEMGPGSVLRLSRKEGTQASVGDDEISREGRDDTMDVLVHQGCVPNIVACREGALSLLHVTPANHEHERIANGVCAPSLCTQLRCSGSASSHVKTNLKGSPNLTSQVCL